jgi:hypothetical protein
MNKNTAYYERLHDVAKAIVDDPDSIDAATVAALKSATMELAERYSNPEYALKQLYAGDTELSADLRQAFAIVGKYEDAADDGDDDAGDRSDENTGLANHPAVRLATVLVVSGKFSNIGDALNFVLNTSHGAALLHRTNTLKGVDPMESIEKLKAERTQNLLAIGKTGGAVAMAKIINADGDAHGIDESTYTQILTDHAQRIYSNDRPDAAFAKLFSDNGADGVLLRKAHAVVRASQFAAGGAYPYPR